MKNLFSILSLLCYYFYYLLLQFIVKDLKYSLMLYLYIKGFSYISIYFICQIKKEQRSDWGMRTDPSTY